MFCQGIEGPGACLHPGQTLTLTAVKSAHIALAAAFPRQAVVTNLLANNHYCLASNASPVRIVLKLNQHLFFCLWLQILCITS